jgi:hypothetical protein
MGEGQAEVEAIATEVDGSLRAAKTVVARLADPFGYNQLDTRASPDGQEKSASLISDAELLATFASE